MNWYFKVISNYAVFKGRARRKEYWYFFLFNLIISFCIGIVFGLTSGLLGMGHTLSDAAGTLYSLAIFLPHLGVAIRRMHDGGRSGWWILFPFVNIVLLCLDSQPGDNEYGPNPKDEPEDLLEMHENDFKV